jgi:hypothetical protein
MLRFSATMLPVAALLLSVQAVPDVQKVCLDSLSFCCIIISHASQHVI